LGRRRQWFRQSAWEDHWETRRVEKSEFAKADRRVERPGEIEKKAHSLRTASPVLSLGRVGSNEVGSRSIESRDVGEGRGDGSSLNDERKRSFDEFSIEETKRENEVEAGVNDLR